jgi:outer membrane lipoprotein-sorting protein
MPSRFCPGKVLRMYPRRKTDLSEVWIEVDPVGYAIRRLVFVHEDGESQEFLFSNIRTNARLQSSLFNFKVPDGVEILDGIGR